MGFIRFLIVTDYFALEDAVQSEPLLVAKTYRLYPRERLLEEQVLEVGGDELVFDWIAKIIHRLIHLPSPLLVESLKLKIVRFVHLDEDNRDRDTDRLELKGHLAWSWALRVLVRVPLLRCLLLQYLHVLHIGLSNFTMSRRPRKVLLVLRNEQLLMQCVLCRSAC